MDNTENLAIFGWAFLIVVGGVIIIPYLRGKTDILNSWNILLLGAGMFTGISCLEVTYGYFHWPETKWFQPSEALQNQYITYSIVFFGAMFFFYYVTGFTRWPANNRLLKWPAASLGLLVYILAVCAVISVLAFVVAAHPFWGSMMRNLSHKAVVFATVFTFVYWYRNKLNVPLLALFIAVFISAALYAMVVFHGRRLIMSVVFGPMLCMYWLSWRYRKPVTNLVLVAGLAAFVVAGGAFYSSFRHFNSKQKIDVQERNVQNIVGAMQGVSLDSVTGQVTRNFLHYFSQYCTHYSLLTIYLIDQGELEVKPLNSLAFLATYPIPRVYWPDKPVGPHKRLLELLNMPYRTNWGLGVVGESYYDGGLPVLILYALLAAIGIRFLDEPMLRQPDNPFLLAIFSAAFPHVLSWTRGGLNIMTIEIVECFVFALLLGYVARLFFGTAETDQPQRWPAYQYYYQPYLPHGHARM